jgi:hypothetical protein
MNGKTKYLILGSAAVFALIFAFATPYVMAQDGDPHEKWAKMKHHKKHMAIQIGELSGSEALTDENRDALKERIVPLGDVADGKNVQMARLGIAVNDTGEKFLVWTLVSMNKSDEGTPTGIIYVIDALTGNEITAIEKTFDRLAMKEKMGKFLMHDKAFFENLDEDAKAQLEAAHQNLMTAKESGDQDQIKAAKETLRSLIESIKSQN